MKILFLAKALIKNKKSFFRDFENAKRSFTANGWVIDLWETHYAKHAIELARKAAEENYTHVISVGGDGTLSEVVNGLLHANVSKLPVIGLLPYGTANDFAKTSGAKRGIGLILNAIREKKWKKIDIGKAKFGKDGGDMTRYFINISDVGIGGHIVQKINQSSKMLGPDLTFMIETLKALVGYKHKSIRCETHDRVWEGKSLAIVISNARFFGSGLCIAPDALLDDGKFDVVILGNVTVRDYLMNLRNLKKGKKLSHPGISYHKADEIKIFSPDGSIPVDMDGELAGYTPVTYSVLPGKIDFIFL